MNERTLRPANLAAAAVVIGSVLIVLLPRHAMSIVQVVIVTIGAGVGLHALILNAPPTWWRSPFDRSAGIRRKRPTFDETSWIRAVLSGRRQKIANGLPLPPETLRVLQPLVRSALERQGIDPDDRRSRSSARTRLSTRTLAILNAKPMKRLTWLDTLGPDPDETAKVVHQVLDELDRLDGNPAEAALTPTERRPT